MNRKLWIIIHSIQCGAKTTSEGHTDHQDPTMMAQYINNKKYEGIGNIIDNFKLQTG